MIPGMNPRKMNQMMKRMGISQNEVDATEVIIRTPDKEIVISNPSVSKVNMMGQQTYQVVGEEEERDLSKSLEAHSEEHEIEINQEDINTVTSQTGVNEETARTAIMDHDGDLAETILDLKKE